MEMIRFLLQITRGTQYSLIAIVTIGLLDVILTLLFVWSSKTLVDIATGDHQGSFLMWASLLGGQIVLQIALRAAEVRITNLTEVKLANRVRHTLFAHLLYVEWHHLSTFNRGDMITRLIRDTDDLVKLLTSALPLALTASVQLLGALVFFYLLDWRLALILTVTIPFLLLLSRLYYLPMKRYTREVKERESTITSHVEESLINQVIIRTFERQEDELERLGILQTDLYESVDRKSKVSLFARAITGLAFQGGYLIAFIRGAFGIAANSITFGTLTAFLQLVGRIQRPLYELTRLMPGLISARTAAERLSGLIQLKRESQEERILFDNPISLVIDGLCYAYPGDRKPIINNLSFTLSPGSMVAIMGESGAGKTTLIRMILALLKPSEGTVELVHGDQRIPVSTATRSNFVYVPQENLLFSGTIRENLLVGDPFADDDRLMHALDTASASFVLRLPEGLDTVVGEGGFGLSEGEAQRITIARSLLRPGKIILLDEATSALDPETERLFLTNLRRELNGRSLLFITHHPEVAAQCDSVFVVE